MSTLRFAILFAALNLVAPAAGPLRVLRATPASPASPAADVTITFDRPVAGGLDESISARSIFGISPAVAGNVEWRDPLTLRFTPDRPFTPGASYTVTIAARFQAMDGSALEQPYTYTFRVSPPTVLAGDPASGGGRALYLPAQPVFRVLLSAPVDLPSFAARASALLDRSCGGTVIALRARDQHPIGAGDPGYFRWTGLNGPMPDTSRDLRRVVELTPVTPLPLDCAVVLRLPAQAGSPNSPLLAWTFRTYGPFRARRADCALAGAVFCPTGPVRIVFSTPVRGSEVLRHLRIIPAQPFTVRDSSDESTEWVLDAQLEPRTSYAVVIDASARDVFAQTLTGVTVQPFRTTGYSPAVSYDYGRMLVEREGLRTLAVQHVNVDTLTVTSVVVPDSMESQFLAREWGWQEPWRALQAGAVTRRISVSSGRDERRISGVPLPQSAARAGGTLVAVQIGSTQLDSMARANRPIALVQVTNLGVHARIGVDEGVVWVTGVNDGLPRNGVAVELHDAKGRVLATGTTDARGLAELRFQPPRPNADGDETCEDCFGLEGYVVARTSEDRALVGVNAWDPDLAPWRFSIGGAFAMQREPAAAALFTERGIYRPGESVYAKAIVRRGTLGQLRAVPGDSLQWIFHDREGGVLRDTTVTLSAFGTADARLRLSPDLQLGWYTIEIRSRLRGQWKTLDNTSYQVAEYRPPEFLLDATAGSNTLLEGDTARVNLSARYLFGAPMAHSPISWYLRLTPQPWGVSIPGAENFTVGASANWWEENQSLQVSAQGSDTLDAGGQRQLRIPLPPTPDGRPATATVTATVTDANRQTVSAGVSMTVHPASFYIGARTSGNRWFWTADQPVTLELITVRPQGERLSGISVEGVIVRREWHTVRRTRDGQVDEIGGWVADTVAHCAVRTAADPVPCTFTPPSGGSYTITFTARDDAGHVATTSLMRWASGRDWVPWNDQSKLKMDVVADKPTYDVGDTATVFFASPFTDAEAWVTVEREHVMESRRIRITSGATTLRFPITDAYAPNVYVSIIVARGRSAPPGPLDDPGRPTIRVGYAELRVLPSVKRLTVAVQPQPKPGVSSAGAGPVEYGPGDSARVALDVKDAAGRPQQSEVTLWAVDEGVLALTGYQLPDPVSLLYAERGLGVRLASNLVSVAPQIPEGLKGRRAAGGGGGSELAGILRSRFQTTAFFLGSVITDHAGHALAAAKLPDNLTTFRVMAVAITAGDLYGSGQSAILVTRPLLARPALPRFVREGDRFTAGVVVNQRAGGTPRVQVDANATGIRLDGKNRKTDQLAAGRGVEVRFDFRALAGDSAHFQFEAAAAGDRDAVAVGIPIRPSYHPLAATLAGVLKDTATAEFTVRDDVDPARSTLSVSFGSSVLAVIDGARTSLRVYPWYCTEQISSVALPVVALYRARRQLGLDSQAAALEADVQTAVRTLARRQTSNGSIGYWSASDWSSPWLSAYAGRVLLEARNAGVPVDSTVLERLADYLGSSLHDEEWVRSPVAWWFRDLRGKLSEHVAAADFLSRMGRPDVAIENSLLQQAARLRWEDRVQLATLFARRRDARTARSLLESIWATVNVEGRRAVLPSTAHDGHYFYSLARPAALLLQATLAVQPDHPLVGPLVETLVDHGRIDAKLEWNTQDLGWTVLALSDYQRFDRNAGSARITVRGPKGNLFSTTLEGVGEHATLHDTTLSLAKLVSKNDRGERVVRLSLNAQSSGSSAAGVPAYFFATVTEVPKTPPVDPVYRGIVVERWYERVDTKQPTVSVAEGDLVRVRLRVTVPDERHFVVVDDALPAGLEPVDLSLRTVAAPGVTFPDYQPGQQDWPEGEGWWYGSWDAGLWSPFDHRELRDDRVVYSATVLWKGTYTATYLARATTAGTFIVPPAWSEEMYNRGVNGRTGGSTFTVTRAAGK